MMISEGKTLIFLGMVSIQPTRMVKLAMVYDCFTNINGYKAIAMVKTPHQLGHNIRQLQLWIYPRKQELRPMTLGIKSLGHDGLKLSHHHLGLNFLGILSL